MDYEDRKASESRQWEETPQRPIATKPMTMAEIEAHRKYIAMSYQCDVSDIRHHFEKIVNPNDEDRDDCLWLRYTMKTFDHENNIVDRVIFSLKLPIPEAVRKRAEEIRKTNAAATGSRRRRTHKTLPAPGDPPGMTPPAMPSAGGPPAGTAPHVRTRPVPRGQRVGPQ